MNSQGDFGRPFLLCGIFVAMRLCWRAKGASPYLEWLSLFWFQSIIFIFMRDTYLFIDLTNFYTAPIYTRQSQFDN
ncbi:hypothetical protein CJU94_30200 [Paraburkholderia aromaticivorans]|uniref:Uncharacterized protein n=1 Tax=Paraburkholderia aromaticivorans TaxID=2026199 RepID=A0A248VU27_9BURK|nr:hypothetical protein CJU94_30200 [Paraburkholderia aromaticivorans]